MWVIQASTYIYIYIAKRRLSFSESSTRTFCVGKRRRGTMGDWEVYVVALLLRVCACVCVETFVPSTSRIVHFRRRGVIISSFFSAPESRFRLVVTLYWCTYLVRVAEPFHSCSWLAGCWNRCLMMSLSCAFYRPIWTNRSWCALASTFRLLQKKYILLSQISRLCSCWLNIALKCFELQNRVVWYIAELVRKLGMRWR